MGDHGWRDDMETGFPRIVGSCLSSRGLEQGLVILASNEGIFRLEPILSTEDVEEEKGEVDTLEGLIDDWISIQVLVDAALRRPGLSESGGMGRTLATALPTLMLEGRYQPGNGGDNYDAGLSSSGSMML